jgi:hypothetical protein
VRSVEDVKKLAEDAVIEAFPVTAPPSQEEMRNNHCPECRDTVAIFLGKRWPEITVADLRGNPAPSLLTASGFRYYLPAMMLRSIEAGEDLDCFPDSVVGMLSPARGHLDEFDRERLEGFGRQQIGAICSFLEFCATRERAEWTASGLADDVLEGMPLHRQLARAIEYWRKWLEDGSS